MPSAIEPDAALPWRRSGDDLLLALRLTPRASKDALEGLDQLSDGRIVLKARVRAVPENGKANEAILKLIAKSLELPRQTVRLESGATSRIKTLRIAGGPDVVVKLSLLLKS